MTFSTFKRLAICVAIAAAPTVVIAQATAPAPANQTGDSAPAKVLNDNSAKPPSANTAGNPSSDRERAIAACDKLPPEQQAPCRAKADKEYGPASQGSEKSQKSGTQ
jgi:hypothetical protein